MLRNVLKKINRSEIHFETLKKSRKPNSYLIAPEALCPFTPDEISPVFDVNKEALMQAFDHMVTAMPNTERVSIKSVTEKNQADYVQYSKGLGFPDTVTIQTLDAGDGKSTLAIYSRAHYGYRDFGVNKKRVKGLIQALQKSLIA